MFHSPSDLATLTHRHLELPRHHLLQSDVAFVRQQVAGVFYHSFESVGSNSRTLR